MAEHGLLTAPNMAAGEPFNVGVTAAALTGAGSTALPGVPTASREQPFPPAEVMEPIRRAERLARAIDDVCATVAGLPLLSQDRVWDRVRSSGLDELLQFDWTMVGESDALAAALAACGALDEIDIGAAEERIKRLREAIDDRCRYLEIPA